MVEQVSQSVQALITNLSREDVLQRICVRPPYYALSKERFLNNMFCAEASAELPQGLALGPMRPGEISRHGAIAGSCAIALKQTDDTRRFYLAVRATYQGFLVDAAYGSTVQFTAVVTDFEKRRASAEVHAYVGSSLLAKLTVDYTIMTPTLFERLNGHRRRRTERLETLKPVGDYPVRWQGHMGVRVIPHLPLSACGGHFDDFPAAPVALLMDQLAQIAERSVGRASYISRGEVTSTNLCWAGETATFTMTKVHHDHDESHFTGGIRGHTTEVGTMKLWLRSPYENTLSSLQTVS